MASEVACWGWGGSFSAAFLPYFARIALAEHPRPRSRQPHWEDKKKKKKAGSRNSVQLPSGALPLLFFFFFFLYREKEREFLTGFVFRRESVLVFRSGKKLAAQRLSRQMFTAPADAPFPRTIAGGAGQVFSQAAAAPAAAAGVGRASR